MTQAQIWPRYHCFNVSETRQDKLLDNSSLVHLDGSTDWLSPFLSLLQPIPFFLRTNTATAPKALLQSPSTVKYHARPAASINGCKMATPAAAIAHLATLVAAAAVLGLSGNVSTSNALYVV